MQRKGGNAAVVTSEEVSVGLDKVKTLATEEEKALRMRHGVSTGDVEAPLPRAAGDNVELADELLVMEMQLLRAMRARAVAAKAAPAPALAPRRAPNTVRPASRTKDKIVRALRKKR